MKKIIVLTILFFVFVLPSSVRANNPSWESFDQNWRDNYIEERLDEIDKIPEPDISEDILEEIFGGKITKDSDYKTHRTGTKTNDKIGVEIIKQKVYQTYLAPDGVEKNRLVDIDSGYALISDNIKLFYNSAGMLGEIITINGNHSDGYMVRKYNKNKRLVQAAYKYKGSYIYLNNGKFAGIKYSGKYYNEKGKEIPKSYMQIYKGLEL